MNFDKWYEARLTIGLIVASVVVSLLSGFGSKDAIFHQLAISQYITSYGYLVEVTDGQLWRLVTPIFMHMSPMHLFMNMAWLFLLGSRIEFGYSSLRLLLMAVVIAVTSNLIQYAIDGPAFGGMSGVVYGLMFYCWAHGRWMPRPRFEFPDMLIGLVIAGDVFMFISNMPIAHWAHAGGAVTGLAWAWFESQHVQQKRR